MNSAKILITEDEALVAEDIKNSILELGYDTPAIAYSGEEALKKIEIFQPDLVLMDINLGKGIDGTIAADVIRKKYKIPVVFLTAYADEKTLEKAKITEPYGYLIKPYNERELHITIEIALYKHKVESELKILRGIIPICAECKKIRNDDGYWKQIDQYFEKYSELKFSHGLCPSCEKQLYGDQDWYNED